MRRLLVVLTIAILPPAGAAQEWNQWRGPSRTGAAPTFTPPASWPERPTQVWKAQVGIGHSSPVIAAGRVYLFSRSGEQEAISARDLASGRELWRQAYAAPYQMNPAAASHGKGPKSTPVVDRGRVFTLGIAGTLSAWQTQDGKLLWRKDFKKEFPSTVPEFGVAMSPIVADNLVILHEGGADGGAVLALDAATGATKWAWKGDGPAYASPIVATLAGVLQVITQSQRHLVSLAVADGRLLWRIPFTTQYEQNAITPIVFGDLVIYSGLNKPAAAVRPTQSAGTWQTPEVWQNADVPMYMSTAVESGGYLYGLTHRSRGQFFCIDARTGKTMWTTKGREAENAALVAAGGLVMAMTTEGELVVMRANPKQFEPIRRYTIADSPVWAHPAPSGGGIVVKDEQSLAYWTF